MIKQVFFPIFGVMAFIALVGIFVQKSATFNLSGTPNPTSSFKTSKEIAIGSTSISVSVADNKDARKVGLSGITSLDKSSGMLFIFDKKNTIPGFWMKDMAIPLDIIWINDNTIVKIDKNVDFPKTGTPDEKLTTYGPGQPIDYVLEVNAGFSDTNNIKVGDKVDL
ncbi:MAG TPA: DUF192 domain-containing protein [Patescibacteria group bacterium]|nr:DUF192 domain-containing protein [Patescibacteria group bacterium]